MSNRHVRSASLVAVLLVLSIGSPLSGWGQVTRDDDRSVATTAGTDSTIKSLLAAKAASRAEEQAKLELGDHPLDRADSTRALSSGDNCDLPLKINLTFDGATLSGLTTCGRGNDYDSTCLGYYDGGEDLIVEVTVLNAGYYGIFIDPEGTPYTGLLVTQSCPPGPDCIGFSFKGAAEMHGVQCAWLDVGVYYVMVDTWPQPDCIPTFTLEFTSMFCDIFNDDCSTPEVISNGTYQPFTTIGAGFDGPGTCMTSPNIWYLYHEEQGDFITINLCGSSFDTKLAVYDGADCNTATMIACNDDACGLQSELDVTTLPGHDYLIEVGGYRNATGDGVISLVTGWWDYFYCWPGMIDEDEPCGEELNDGCNTDPPLFSEIASGDSICGTIWADGGSRDTDWYRLVLEEQSDVTLQLLSDEELVLGLVKFSQTGVIDCDSALGLAQPNDIAYAYHPAEVTLTRPEGEYAVFVAPQDYYGLPCSGWLHEYGLFVSCLPHDTVYCETGGGCDEHIARVQMGDINNESDCDGYSDFTTVSTVMEAGGEYPFTVTSEGGYAGDDCAVWVDWNRDYFFADPEERIPLAVETGYGPFSGVVTVPPDAEPGPTRLRVRLSFFGDAEAMAPCGITQWGEVEDYTIEIVEAGQGWQQDPDPFMVFHKFAFIPSEALVILSDAIAPGTDLSTWENVQLRVGGCSIPLTSVEVAPGNYGELSGTLMWLRFIERDFIECVEDEIGGLIFDTVVADFTVDYEINGVPGSWSAGARIRGHRSGDLNLDGEVNIGDVALMVGYLFGGATLDEPGLADIDGDGAGNVSDLTWLIAFLFTGGPPPVGR